MFRKSLGPLLVKVTEREPTIGRDPDSPQALKRKIDAMRRQKLALFNGTPKLTKRAHTLFSDISSREDSQQALKEHNQSFGVSPPAASQWSNKGQGALDDADGFHTRTQWLNPNSKEARDQRKAKLEEYLLANGATKSTLDVTKGGEEDIDLGGMPEEQFHNSIQGGMTVPEDSALNLSVLNRDPRLDKSRLGRSTWGLSTTTDFGNEGEDSNSSNASPRSTQQATAEHQKGGGGYSRVFPTDANLEDQGEYHQRTVSIYSNKRLYVEGLCGYNEVVSEHEERELCSELLKCLLHPSVEYNAEECRYSCNIFERRLGINNTGGGEDQLAFSFNDTPVLQGILRRFHMAGMIPALPNTAQVNEFCGPFAGYPPHRKNQNFGPYYGILNLLSPCVISMRHIDYPWAPSFYTTQRSLFTVQQPCLGEYKVGTANRAKEFQPFRFQSRMTRDYRIEVLFATVDVPQVKVLRDSVNMTEYAEKRQRGQHAPQLTSSVSNSRSGGRSSAQPRSGFEEDSGSSDAKLTHGLRPGEKALLRQMKEQTRSSLSPGKTRRS